jgi:hypothetical protein
MQPCGFLVVAQGGPTWTAPAALVGHDVSVGRTGSTRRFRWQIPPVAVAGRR